MKYLGVIFFSTALLVVLLCRREGILRMRKWLHNEDPNEKRKKEYKGILFLWVIATIIALLYVIIFVD